MNKFSLIFIILSILFVTRIKSDKLLEKNNINIYSKIVVNSSLSLALNQYLCKKMIKNKQK